MGSLNLQKKVSTFSDHRRFQGLNFKSQRAIQSFKMRLLTIVTIALVVSLTMARPHLEKENSELTRREIILNLLEEVRELKEEKRGTKTEGEFCTQGNSDCAEGLTCLKIRQGRGAFMYRCGNANP